VLTHVLYSVYHSPKHITPSSHKKSAPTVTNQDSCTAQVSNKRYILNLTVVNKCLFALTSYLKHLLLLF